MTLCSTLRSSSTFKKCISRPASHVFIFSIYNSQYILKPRMFFVFLILVLILPSVPLIYLSCFCAFFYYHSIVTMEEKHGYIYQSFIRVSTEGIQNSKTDTWLQLEVFVSSRMPIHQTKKRLQMNTDHQSLLSPAERVKWMRPDKEVCERAE